MSKNKDFKTRLKIEKDKLDNQKQSENEKEAHL